MSGTVSCRRLILVRHGESEANAANIFTGWSDPPLTHRGADEARELAHRLAQASISIDVIFSSSLQRAIESAEIARDELGLGKVKVETSQALNERDYGELTGLNKQQTVERYGADQVHRWRRSWAEAPPEGESLRDTAARVLPFYIHAILPNVMRGRSVLVMAHGNSLRALCMALEGLSTKQVEELEIATGSCRLYLLAADTSIIQATLLETDRAESLLIGGAVQ
jgi:2,3-bisphosphoglycerate-dependent phosphoglycerate mutase